MKRLSVLLLAAALTAIAVPSFATGTTPTTGTTNSALTARNTKAIRGSSPSTTTT